MAPGITTHITTISDSISPKRVRKYTDSIQKQGKFVVPDSIMSGFNPNMSVMEYRTYYFEESPSEIYLVTFSSGLKLTKVFVYNPQKKYVFLKGDLNSSEITRMVNRFNDEVIYEIENYLVKNNINDSLR